MNLKDFRKELEHKEKELKILNDEAKEKKIKEKLKFQNQENDFKSKTVEFRNKIAKSLVRITGSSNGTFTFQEMPENIVYHNDPDAENARIRKEFKYDFDNKEELNFDFNIITGKNNSYNLTSNFFNIDDDFSVVTVVTDYENMVENKINFQTFIDLDFEEYIFGLLSELK